MQDNDLVQFWTFKKLPTKLNVGDRIYFVKNNHIECSMKVIEISKNDWERCETTGRVWQGKIVYINDLKYENLDFKIKGFQGFRYKWWED